MSIPEKLFHQINTLEDLENLLVNQSAETLHLEFKRKRLDAPDLSDGLDVNLSTAISGFANADGGVLIIGINAPSRGEISKAPLKALGVLENRINEYIPRSTSFGVEGILIKKIYEEEEKDEGYIAILIPSSNNSPHRSQKDSKYYLRIGESFLAMEHYQVADMFGRRQRPVIVPYAVIYKDINSRDQLFLVIGLKNTGRAIAKFPFLKINQLEGFEFNVYGISGSGDFGIPRFIGARGYDEYRGGVNDVIQCGSDLPVTRLKRPFQLDSKGQLAENFESISIKGTVAADSFPQREWIISIKFDEIKEALAKNHKIIIDGTLG